MTPRAAAAALTGAFRDPAQPLAGLLFWLPGAAGLAMYHGFTGSLRPVGVLGCALLFAIMLPGLAAYLLRLVEARALGRRPPVPGIDSFLPFSGERRLFPLLPVGLLAAPWLLVTQGGPPAALWLTLPAGALLLPFHGMLLAITDSPLASLSPAGLWRLARRLWPAWLWLLAVEAAAAATLVMAAVAGAPDWLLLLVVIGFLLVLANLCGALLATLDVAAETAIAPALSPRQGEVDRAADRERRQVLDHAYGLVSRGNRAGGFAHIAEHTATEIDPLAADLWFFEALWDWDLGEVPLFYAQSLLTRLLDAGDRVAAMKVTLRCLGANPRFRPHAADLPRLRATARELGNDDVAAALGP